MSFLNKKVLAAAVAGALFSGAAFAAPLDVDMQYYAQEIILPANGLPLAAAAAAPAITWESGYSYSLNEVKHVRVELTGARFANTLTTAPTVLNGDVGNINGLGTNAIYFSVTSTGGAPNNIDADSVFTFPTAGNIVVTSKDGASVKVELYNSAVDAQNANPAGRINAGSFDLTQFLTFVQSYEFQSDANLVLADITADPAYSSFVADASTDPATTATSGTLNNDLRIALRDTDPDTAGVQPTRNRTGAAIQLTDLFAATSNITVTGDFSAANTVTLGGVAAAPGRSGTPATYGNALRFAGVPGTVAAPLVYVVNGAEDRAIAASTFRATFNPVSAAPANYAVTPLSLNNVGAIRRTGTELQAPFVQVPPAWTSRLVLTNTGSTPVNATLTFMSEDGNANYTGANNITRVIQPGTNVIDLQPLMTSFADMQRRRGSIVVLAETVDQTGPESTVQGLLQIVNLQSNSITNHVLVRPGTN